MLLTDWLLVKRNASLTQAYAKLLLALARWRFILLTSLTNCVANLILVSGCTPLMPCKQTGNSVDDLLQL